MALRRDASSKARDADHLARSGVSIGAFGGKPDANYCDAEQLL
jgi:hypothetical protein